MMIHINDKAIATNREGYLLNSQDWDQEIAVAIAKQLSLELTDSHWLIIDFMRTFYQRYQAIPLMRLFIKAIRAELGDEVANSGYLNQLFPPGFLKTACKIAGLPKPRHCM